MKALWVSTLLLAGLCVQPPAGQDWPGFLGPTADGKSTEKLAVPWPKDGLKALWHAELRDGYATCAVSGGRCFLFDRVGNEVRARAAKAISGQIVWEKRFPTSYVDQFGYDGGPRTAPVADGERVYLYGADGWLRCLQAADGALLWEKDTFKEYAVIPNFFGVGCSPIVEGELLIVPVGGSPPGSSPERFGELKGAGTGLVAFDRKTGKEAWRCSDELASYATPRIVAGPDGKRRGLWFARGGLVGFDPAAGKQTFFFPWRARALESVNASTPVVQGQEAFLTECYGPGGVLLKLKGDAAPEAVWSDKEKGRNQSLMCHWATPIVHEGHLYGSHSRHTGDAELRCVEWSTGKVKWRQKGLGRCSLLYADGHFIVLCEEGQLLLVKANPEKFALVSMCEPKLPQPRPDGKPDFLLEYPAWAAPILANGRLYVRGKDRLACLDVPRPTW